MNRLRNLIFVHILQIKIEVYKYQMYVHAKKCNIIKVYTPINANSSVWHD